METTVLLPGILLLLGLVVFGARIALAQQAVGQAVAQAARAASLQRVPDLADADARASLAAGLAEHNVSCRTTTVTLDLAGLHRPAGTAASVSVSATCTVSMGDVSLPGVPGEFTISATHSSPVDAYRGP